MDADEVRRDELVVDIVGMLLGVVPFMSPRC